MMRKQQSPMKTTEAGTGLSNVLIAHTISDSTSQGYSTAPFNKTDKFNSSFSDKN